MRGEEAAARVMRGAEQSGRAASAQAHQDIQTARAWLARENIPNQVNIYIACHQTSNITSNITW